MAAISVDSLLKTMATPLIIPPPLPLPLPDQRGCSRCRLGGGVPGVSYSLSVFARFGIYCGRSAFLPVLRPLPEFGYLVHAGKFPSHQRRSPYSGPELLKCLVRSQDKVSFSR
jgi:hypothetical protein